MNGETDLAHMLATMRIVRRGEPVTMVSLGGDRVADLALDDGILALIREAEGVTVVATVAEALRRGWSGDFVAAWLTVDIHSALEAVGLTDAMSSVLTAAQIPCNVIAGFYHDHLLVPLDRVDDAITALESLRTTPPC